MKIRALDAKPAVTGCAGTYGNEHLKWALRGPTVSTCCPENGGREETTEVLLKRCSDDSRKLINNEAHKLKPIHNKVTVLLLL